ncbi:hypothetical protein B0T26DRAFT_787555 [Lasiosphaeria miniovina]|uniref:Protein kinase domain-containing protein n=1 Tax=Lasiosphaeria miniovina TaxID=1954250 RepID=A0AA40A6S4_9PEZI|nr:uncharacterized protein B0T26DRAFT_787555 [Lasiosphaeria miniovina]KAK0710206.1 hypothetical protein B0T26DRAFT_787555 [Lasiosphaeria miniovina]
MPRFEPNDYEAHLFDIYAESEFAKQAFQARFTEQALDVKPRVKKSDKGELFIQVYPTIAEYKNEKRAGRLLTFGNIPGDPSHTDISVEKEFVGYESYLYLDPDHGSLFLHVLKGRAKISVNDQNDQAQVSESSMPGTHLHIPDTTDSVIIEMGTKGYKFSIHWKDHHKATAPTHPRSLEIRSFLGRLWERQPDNLLSPDQLSPWILGRYGDLKPLARRSKTDGTTKTFAVKEATKGDSVAWAGQKELFWLKKLRHYLTEQKLAHRDLKQENILFEEVHVPMDHPKDIASTKYLFQLIDFAFVTRQDDLKSVPAFGSYRIREGGNPTHPGVDLAEFPPILFELMGITCDDEEDELDNKGWDRKAKALGAVNLVFHEHIPDLDDILKSGENEQQVNQKLHDRYLKKARGLLHHKNATGQSIIPQGYHDMYEAADPNCTTTALNILEKFRKNHDYLLPPLKTTAASNLAAITNDTSTLKITPGSSKH